MQLLTPHYYREPNASSGKFHDDCSIYSLVLVPVVTFVSSRRMSGHVGHRRPLHLPGLQATAGLRRVRHRRAQRGDQPGAARRRHRLQRRRLHQGSAPPRSSQHAAHTAPRTPPSGGRGGASAAPLLQIHLATGCCFLLGD